MPLNDRGIEYTPIDEVMSGVNCPQQSGGKGFIRIIPDSPRYSGEYLCKLDNGAGSVNVTYTIRVIAPPPQPSPASLVFDKYVAMMRYEIPVPEELWDVTAYHVVVETDTEQAFNVSFAIASNTVDILGESENFEISIRDFIEVEHKNIDKRMVRYRMHYNLSNHYGTSVYSDFTPWSVPHDQFDNSLTVTVRSITDSSTPTNTSIKIRVNKLDYSMVNVTYFPESNGIESSETVTIAEGTSQVNIGSLEKNTR